MAQWLQAATSMVLMHVTPLICEVSVLIFVFKLIILIVRAGNVILNPRGRRAHLPINPQRTPQLFEHTYFNTAPMVNPGGRVVGRSFSE